MFLFFFSPAVITPFRDWQVSRLNAKGIKQISSERS